METAKLCEIIVYPMNRAKYEEKIELLKREHIQNYLNKNPGDSYEKAQNSFLTRYKYATDWDYNRLCGVICIYYCLRSGEIYFDVYEQKHNIYNKKTTLRLNQINGSNLHIHARGETSKTIYDRIDTELKYIKDSFFKGRYLDLECYNNLKKVLDISAWIKTIDII